MSTTIYPNAHPPASAVVDIPVADRLRTVARDLSRMGSAWISNPEAIYQVKHDTIRELRLIANAIERGRA